MNIQHRFLCLLLPASLAMIFSLNATAETAQAKALRLLSAPSGEPAAAVRNASGYVTQLRIPAPQSDGSTAARDARAREFLLSTRDAFLDTTTPLDFAAVHVSPLAADGSNHVRLQQSFKGIPVRGGEAIVHLNSAGVTLVESNLLSDLTNVDVTPQIRADEAVAAAHAAVSKRLKNRVADFGVPQLEIINIEQLRGYPAGVSHLAWLVHATGGVNESIWVDAHNGKVLLQVNRVAHALARDVEDIQGACTNNIISPISYSEGAPAPPAGDALFAWNNAKATYDFFNTNFGADGIDGNGNNGTLVVSVCTADPVLAHLSQAPLMEHAAWDGISQMLFGSGMTAAVDIVAHEYTHALIDNVNNGTVKLLLTGQPGALAEAFADIFGEAVEAEAQAKSTSTWDIGEAATGGPFRNLMNPSAYNLPGKVTDPKIYCGKDDDLAIHTNSAVLSHAFALLADGGTYNGVTITGIGMKKAAQIFYRALTVHLPSSSSFVEAYNALLTSADDLVKTQSISAAESDSLSKALSAVELYLNPCNAKLPYCPTGFGPSYLFYDNFENTTSGSWTNSVTTGVNHWISQDGTSGIYRPNINGDASNDFYINKLAFARSGKYALWADNARPTNAGLGDSAVAMNPSFVIPASGNPRLQFEHMFDFAPGGLDGGLIEYSTDNGATWANSTALISDGQGYGKIASGFNPLDGSSAFVGSTGGAYVSTQLDLRPLAGNSVKFRFRMGTDDYASYLGWLIDDVALYTCTETLLIVNADVGLTTTEGGGTATFTVNLSAAPTAEVILDVTSDTPTEGMPSPSTLKFNESNWNIPQTVTVTGVDDNVVDGEIPYNVTIAVSGKAAEGYSGLTSYTLSLTNLDNDTATTRKHKGGAWDVFSILLMLGLIGVTHLRRRIVELAPFV